MATNHGLLGDEHGKWSKVINELTQLRDGSGGTVTMTPVEDLRSEIEALLDADDTGKFLLRRALQFLEAYSKALNGLLGIFYSRVFFPWIQQRVRTQVDSKATRIPDVIHDWFLRMITDGEDLEALTVSLSSGPTADANNVGDVTLVVAITEPYEGRNNERIQNAKYAAVCRSSPSDGSAQPNNETFQISNDFHESAVDVDVKLDEGADKNRAKNGSFENFTTADTPDDWTLDAGTAGNHIFEDGTNKFRGSKALKLQGDGVLGSIILSQAETAMAGYAVDERLKALRHYVLSARIKTDASAGIAAGDTLTIQLQGDAYTPSASEKIAITGPDATGWTLYKATLILPANISADNAKLTITYAGTPGATNIVQIDDLILQEMTEHQDAGTNYALIPGATSPVGGGEGSSVPHQDIITFETTNSWDKKLQTALARATKAFDLDKRDWPTPNRMLPSAGTASAAYAESKAS